MSKLLATDQHIADGSADAALVNHQIAAIAQRWPSEHLTDMVDYSG
jgi:hypothetical protein